MYCYHGNTLFQLTNNFSRMLSKEMRADSLELVHLFSTRSFPKSEGTMSIRGNNSCKCIIISWEFRMCGHTPHTVACSVQCSFDESAQPCCSNDQSLWGLPLAPFAMKGPQHTWPAWAHQNDALQVLQCHTEKTVESWRAGTFLYTKNTVNKCMYQSTVRLCLV